MRGVTSVDKAEKIGMTLPISPVKHTDKVRRDIPRSTYIRSAIETYLKEEKSV